MASFNLTEYAEKQGCSIPSQKMYEEIEVWRELYEGEETSYNVYNGTKYVKQTRKSLEMPKKLCEDKADLIMNEKVNISVCEDKIQEAVFKVLYDNNFYVETNQLVEITSALGTGCVLMYIENEEVKFDYLSIDQFVPCINEKGEIYKIYTGYPINDKYAQIHSYQIVGDQTLVEDYVIEIKSGDRMYEMDEDGNPVANEDIYLPCIAFHILKPNIKNNIDMCSPLGISIYANSLDVLESVDIVYDSYVNEFKLGKKRIFIHTDLLNIDINGKQKPVFDSKEAVFYGVDMESMPEKIKEINMALRSEEHSKALQENLAILGSKCGFGNSYYTFEKGSVKTATEVISENSEMYRKLRKEEILVEKFLIDIISNLIKLMDLSMPDGCEIKIEFDDSIIEDTTAKRQQVQLEYNMGVFDKVEYLKRVYNLSDEEAKTLVKDMEERQPQQTFNMGDFGG